MRVAVLIFVCTYRKFPVAKHTDTLSLVKFQGEFFPLAEVDYRLLVERKVSVFRISESTLDILSKVLLKGVKIEQHSWGTVYPQLIQTFKDSFTGKSVDSDTFQFSHKQDWVIVMTDTSNPETAEENCNTCNQHCNQLREFMGRYGLQTKIETKKRDSSVLTRLTFVPDENIVPSFFFGCKEDYNAPLMLDFNLSSSARLRFSKRLTMQGEPTFALSFEDRFGDHFEEAFVRAFPFSSVSAKDCEHAIEFFVNLHSRLTVKKKK